MGIEVALNASGMYLNQWKYALDIISKTGLSGSKPVITPIEQNHHLATHVGPYFSTPNHYRRLIGRLIYLTITRPELASMVHVLAQFTTRPRQAHWDAALHVVPFLNSSPGQGIFLSSVSTLTLSAYCYINSASCPLTHRSPTGYFYYFGYFSHFWKTKK